MLIPNVLVSPEGLLLLITRVNYGASSAGGKCHGPTGSSLSRKLARVDRRRDGARCWAAEHASAMRNHKK